MLLSRAAVENDGVWCFFSFQEILIKFKLLMRRKEAVTAAREALSAPIFEDLAMTL